MALPPEPISFLLPLSDLILDAEVSSLDEERNDAPLIDEPGELVGVGYQYGSQIVRLRTYQTLKGDVPPGELVAVKPIASYQLMVGTRGPFLLKRQAESWIIVGRYGPYYRTVDEVSSALSDHEASPGEVAR